jgi:hypothetical protein
VIGAKKMLTTVVSPLFYYTVVARAKKAYNTIVSDFYERFYCTRFLRGIVLFQISTRNTILPDSTGQRNLESRGNISF